MEFLFVLFAMVVLWWLITTIIEGRFHLGLALVAIGVLWVAKEVLL